MKVTALLLLLAACRGGDRSGAAEPPKALPDGRYEITPITCLTTRRAPIYPAANYKVVFGAFDELRSASLVLSGSEARYLYEDGDCRLAVTRIVHQNAVGMFSLKLARVHTWEPSGCLLTVVVNGVRSEVGKGFGDLFEDDQDFREEVPFDVAGVGTAYELVSDDREDLDKLWASYGCAASDRIVTTYNLTQ